MPIKEVEHQGVLFLQDQAIADAGGVVHGFSTRIGGVSQGIFTTMNLGTTRGDEPQAVRENYSRFLTAIGAESHQIVMANQVHSDRVRMVTKVDIKTDLYRPEGYEVDGLVSNLPGVNLVVFSADCLPVLLYDPVRQVVAAVHAGWRGTAQNIVGNAVEKMALYGSEPGDVLAAIGPGISKCCFETHEDVPNAMTAALGSGVLPYIGTIEGGKFNVDLKGVNAMLLGRAGLSEDHISVAADCTACLPEKYWSHRITQGERGSQIAMIGLT